jgi:hypothetical protein
VGAPSNPILSHRSTTHPVQNTGHADLVQTSDGAWAMVYLGVRPRGVTPMFHVNGRETFLAGVDWRDDWPVVDEGRYPRPAADTSYTDRFETPRLHPRWVSPGAGLGDVARPRPDGGLVLRPATSASGVAGALTARVLDHSWSFEADVDLTDGAGALLVRLDDRHWCEVRADAERAYSVVRIGPLQCEHGSAVALNGPRVTLRVESLPSLSAGPDDLRLTAVVAGHAHELARIDGRYLSTEVAGGFTGRVTGVRATEGEIGLIAVRYAAVPDHL